MSSSCFPTCVVAVLRHTSMVVSFLSIKFDAFDAHTNSHGLT